VCISLKLIRHNYFLHHNNKNNYTYVVNDCRYVKYCTTKKYVNKRLFVKPTNSVNICHCLCTSPSAMQFCTHVVI